MLALATQQEKHYLRCNTYATAIAGATDCGASQLQGRGDEQERLVPARDDPGARRDDWLLRRSATAIAGQNQYQDEACRSFTVTQAGVRSALNSSGADNTAECWR